MSAKSNIAVAIAIAVTLSSRRAPRRPNMSNLAVRTLPQNRTGRGQPQMAHTSRSRSKITSEIKCTNIEYPEGYDNNFNNGDEKNPKPISTVPRPQKAGLVNVSFTDGEVAEPRILELRHCDEPIYR